MKRVSPINMIMEVWKEERWKKIEESMRRGRNTEKKRDE